MKQEANPTVKKSSNGAIFYGDPLPYPISRAVRAGDFVITSGFGDRVLQLEEQRTFGPDTDHESQSVFVMRSDPLSNF